MRRAYWWRMWVLLVLLVACPNVAPRYLLEVSGGTYVQQVTAGQPETRVGTNLIVKLRTRDGGLVKNSGNVTVFGPTNWNGGQPVYFAYPTSSVWVSAPQAKVTVLPGKYTVRVSIDGEQLSKTFDLSPNDLRQTVDLANMNATYVESDTTQKVMATWQPVVGAVGYYVRVLDGTINQVVSSTVYTLGESAEIPVDILSPSRAYFVVVVASNIDTVADNPIFPTVFNSSDSLAGLNLTTQRIQKTNLKERITEVSKIP